MRPAGCFSRPSPSRVRHGYVPPSHKAKGNSNGVK